MPRGGVATARHPRAGTGRFSYYPGHGGYYPRRGYYPPYYRAPYYGYYAYYRPYPYFSFYFGWPYYSSAWWPYGYYAPSYSVSYYAPPSEAPAAPQPGETHDAPRPLDPNRDVGRIRLEVRPDDASVYVDDEFWGSARESRFLTLRSGRHTIDLVRPGFEVVHREVELARGETSDVLVEMRRP